MTPRSIPELLEHWAHQTPEAPALLTPGRQPLSYAKLHEQTARFAARLRSSGVNREVRVAILHPNGPELAAVVLGVSSAAVAAPLNPAYRISEPDFYLGDLRARGSSLGRQPHADVLGQTLDEVLREAVR